MVFKNCARQEPKDKVRSSVYPPIIIIIVQALYLYSVACSSLSLQERHFINDTIRSEFHKKFMDKYVK